MWSSALAASRRTRSVSGWSVGRGSGSDKGSIVADGYGRYALRWGSVRTSGGDPQVPEGGQSAIERGRPHGGPPGGEEEAASLAAEFDGWSGPIEVTVDEIASATGSLPPTVFDDIAFTLRLIRYFARAQRDSMFEFAVELSPGLPVGQRLVPVEVAGCYVPAGRFAPVASALVSVATASVGGRTDHCLLYTTGAADE